MQRQWREMEQDQLPEGHHAVLLDALVYGRRCASLLQQLRGVAAMLAQQGRDASQVRAAAVAAGEAALRLSGLTSTSPAWAEALRAREEVEHLGRMAGQLAETLVPRLRQVESMQGDMLNALETITEAVPRHLWELEAQVASERLRRSPDFGWVQVLAHLCMLDRRCEDN